MRRSLITVRRRAQSRLIRAIRSSRFFPRVVVNRLGEDDQLADERFGAAVVVYFPGALDTLYQLDPWAATFRAVHDALGLVVVCQDSRVTEAVRERTGLTAHTIARYGTLDAMLARSDVKLALYVSHQPRNFEALRFASLLHAYIGHGDSDKGVSASNQLKAYDLVFAPGQAAVDRIEARLMRFDADRHCVIVGQPTSLSAPVPERRPVPVDGRATVLYAPTWEGGQPSVAYSSVLSHGPALVERLLADSRFRVVYRPHPLIGVTSGAYAAADGAIRAAIDHAIAHDPLAGHRVALADQEPIEVSFADADALVCDISAVATGWLPSLRPLVITVPTGPAAQAADSGMLGAVPRLQVNGIAGLGDVLWAELADDAGRSKREELVAYYLSPYWPDQVEARFVTVCRDLVAERDRLRSALLADGATGV